VSSDYALTGIFVEELAKRNRKEGLPTLTQSPFHNRSEVMRLSLFSLLLCLIGGCDALLRPRSTINDIPPERRIAFAAVYGQSGTWGPIHRIVVADFQNPSTHFVISRGDHSSVHPRLNPSRELILLATRTAA
jgi:hypothetical protein